jgi:Tol biopolymer transport system component
MDVDVDSDKGAYIITDIEKEVLFTKNRVITWNAFMRDGQKQNYGFLSSFSPDGRYVISTIRELPIYHLFPDPGNPQLFFPVRGILALYDRKTKTFASLPGADNPSYVQTNAVWSPDGKWIVFARAKALDKGPDIRSFINRSASFRYDLYRIPFNDGKGGKAEPVAGASENGRSNYFPKFTPDGKWLIYTQSDSFMLNQPDAELHIIPADGGKDRKMICNTPGKMSSWHSISPNGKWMVFASKANRPYTELWLTHLNKEGNDTPPVLLEDYTDWDKAANLPEFMNIPADMLIRINNCLN